MEENVLVEFFRNTPSLDVEIELVVRRNVSWTKDIDENDLADIAVLSIAIPYCDIVVTEKSWKDFIVRSGLDKKYNTVVINGVKELDKYL